MSSLINHSEISQTGRLELLARHVVEGFITGLHRSPFHGFSVEFAEHRLYNTGESVKHIDWKLYGRTDKLFVKKYEEETNLRCQLVIDNSSSMHYPVQEKGSSPVHSKFSFAVHCAAALAYLLKRQRDAAGLSIFSDTLELHTPAKSGYAHQKMLLAELEKRLLSHHNDRNKKTCAAEAIHQIADNIHKRSLVILFSDMMESGEEYKIFPALQHLRHNKHEVILFHTTDKKKEEDFVFENRPYRFIDIESGEEIKVNSARAKPAYTEAIKQFKKMLALKCGQYRIDLVEADIQKGYQQVLLPYLIKREKMKS